MRPKRRERSMRSLGAQANGRHDWTWSAVTWMDDDGLPDKTPWTQCRRHGPRPWPRGQMWKMVELSAILKPMFPVSLVQSIWSDSPLLGMIPKSKSFTREAAP